MSSTALAPQAAHTLAPVTPIPQLIDQAHAFVGEAQAANTRRGYASDWADFVQWCARYNVSPLPADPGTVVLYLSDLAQRLKAATIQRRCAAITHYHETAKHPTPIKDVAVKTAMAGIRRTLGTAPNRKAPTLIENIREMVQLLPKDSLAGKRDRALLLVGFAGAFRRSELVGLDVRDIAIEPKGLRILIRRSKTDQEGAGREVGIPKGAKVATCPVRAYQAWLAAAQLSDGPAFRAINRHGKISRDRLNAITVVRLVKRLAEATGLDPELFAGHSLRAGLVTSAIEAGVSVSNVMRTTGHKSAAMVERYNRSAKLFEHNAAGGVGL